MMMRFSVCGFLKKKDTESGSKAYHEPQKDDYSTDFLSHFKCGKCHKWWSIGDAPATKVDWFCPWCGLKTTFQNYRLEGEKTLIIGAGGGTRTHIPLRKKILSLLRLPFRH